MAIIFAFVAFIGISIGTTIAFGQENLPVLVIMEVLVTIVGLAIVSKVWPELFKTLVAYAFAAGGCCGGASATASITSWDWPKTSD